MAFSYIRDICTTANHFSFPSEEEQLWCSIITKPISFWEKQHLLKISQTIVNHSLEILYETFYQRKVIDFLSSKQFSHMRFPDSQDSLLKERVALIMKDTGLFHFSEDSQDIFEFSLRSETWAFFNYLIELCPYEHFPNHKMRLFMACARGDLNFIKSHLLQNKGEYLTKTNWNISLLHIACGVGNLDIVKFLVEEAKFWIEEKREDGYTALHIAAVRGHLNVVEYLLSKSAHIECLTKYRETPLFLASNKDHSKIVNFLLESGAKIDCPDKFGIMPLYDAVKRGHADVVKVMIDFFPDLVESDCCGFPALYHAVNFGRLEVTKVLIEAGTEVNRIIGSSRSTCFHGACRGGHLKIALELIKSGTDPTIEDGSKKTPLQYLKKDAWDSLIPLIIEESALLEKQVVQLKESLSYLNEKDGKSSDLSLETLDQDLKRSRMLQKVISSFKIILEEYEGKIDIESANQVLKKTQKILTPLLGSLIQLKNKLKAEQVETHFVDQSLPIIDIEKAVVGLGLLVPEDYERLNVNAVKNRDGLIACGLLNEDDLRAIDIDQAQVEKINGILDSLSMALNGKLKQRLETTDPRASQLELVAHLKTKVQEIESLWTETLSQMKQIFGDDLNLPFLEFKTTKDQIDSLRVGCIEFEKELLALFEQQESSLKKLLILERQRLFLMLRYYLKQPHLGEIFKGIKTSENITSLSEFRKIMAPKFSDEISLTKSLYDLNRTFLILVD